MSILSNQILLNATRMAGQPPVVLPANTLRFQFSDTSYTPTVGASGSTSRIGSWTAYDASNGIWDWKCDDASWYRAFRDGLRSNLIGTGNYVELIMASNNITATNMTEMFYRCNNLTNLVLFDTSSVTDIAYMFYGCTSLTSVPLFNFSLISSMSHIFHGCSSLTSIPMFNTSSVTNMDSMLINCTSLTSVPLLNTSSVTNMYYMFNGCTSLESIPLFDTSLVTNMEGMFQNCKQVKSGSLALYTQASTQTTPPSSYRYCFTNCGIDTTTGAAELAQIPTSWGGTMSA